MATTMVSVRLPGQRVDALDAEAQRSGGTRTGVVRTVLELGLRLEAPEDDSTVSDRELANQLEAAVTRPKTAQLARRDRAAELGISDGRAQALLAKRERGAL
jgi:hypothetical protein